MVIRLNFSFSGFGYIVGSSGIGLSSVGSLYFPEVWIKEMGKRHPIRLSIVSWETASHLAAPVWDQVRKESEGLISKK